MDNQNQELVISPSENTSSVPKLYDDILVEYFETRKSNVIRFYKTNIGAKSILGVFRLYIPSVYIKIVKERWMRNFDSNPFNNTLRGMENLFDKLCQYDPQKLKVFQEIYKLSLSRFTSMIFLNFLNKGFVAAAALVGFIKVIKDVFPEFSISQIQNVFPREVVKIFRDFSSAGASEVKMFLYIYGLLFVGYILAVALKIAYLKPFGALISMAITYKSKSEN